MSSGAAQLPSHRGGRCRHHGAVMGCRAPQTLQPQRGLRHPAGGRRRRGRPGCPDAGHAVRRPVRVRCPDVRPTGRADVRCPRVRCPRVRCPGDRCPHHRCDPGVRTDTRPVSAAAAAALSAPRWTRNPSVRPGPATAGAAGSTGSRWSVSGLVVAARIGPGGTGMVEGCRAWLAPGSTPGLGRRFAGVQAAAPRSPPRRPGELVPRQVPAGWRGSGEGAGAPTSPQVRPGQGAGGWPTMGLDREAVTTLRGR
jgi:hypothetical protein